MIEYSEKRGYQRVTMECPASYRPQGVVQAQGATVKNLSSSGVLLITEQALAIGLNMGLQVEPGKTITPPLSAEVKVLRCEHRDDGKFNVVCTIQRILSEEEAGPDFP